MKKYLIAIITIFCLSTQLRAQVTEAFKKVATDTNRIVYDEQGNALHYYQYNKLVNSGDYTIRYHGRPGDTSVKAHLMKLTDVDKARFLVMIKERLSIKSGKLKEGNALDLTPLQGALGGVDFNKKVVVLVFWSSGCPPCTESFDGLNNIFAQLPNPQDVVLIAITGDDKESALAKLKEKPLLNAQQITNGGGLYSAYDMNTTSGYVVADKDHIVRLALSGMSPLTLTAIKSTIASALAQ